MMKFIIEVLVYILMYQITLIYKRVRKNIKFILCTNFRQFFKYYVWNCCDILFSYYKYYGKSFI